MESSESVRGKERGGGLDWEQWNGVRVGGRFKREETVSTERERLLMGFSSVGESYWSSLPRKGMVQGKGVQRRTGGESFFKREAGSERKGRVQLRVMPRPLFLGR